MGRELTCIDAYSLPSPMTDISETQSRGPSPPACDRKSSACLFHCLSPCPSFRNEGSPGISGPQQRSPWCPSRPSCPALMSCLCPQILPSTTPTVRGGHPPPRGVGLRAAECFMWERACTSLHLHAAGCLWAPEPLCFCPQSYKTFELLTSRFLVLRAQPRPRSHIISHPLLSCQTKPPLQHLFSLF